LKYRIKKKTRKARRELQKSELATRLSSRKALEKVEKESRGKCKIRRGLVKRKWQIMSSPICHTGRGAGIAFEGDAEINLI